MKARPIVQIVEVRGIGNRSRFIESSGFENFLSRVIIMMILGDLSIELCDFRCAQIAMLGDPAFALDVTGLIVLDEGPEGIRIDAQRAQNHTVISSADIRIIAV